MTGTPDQPPAERATQYNFSDDDTVGGNQGGSEKPSPEDIDASFEWETDGSTDFQDIAGYEDVKTELFHSVIDPDVNSPEAYERFMVDSVRGILLHGPPGTGKTMFGRALADVLDRPFVELNQADLTSKWINESPQIVQELFEEANQLGGVIFVDEAEQLLGRRSGPGDAHSEDKKLTNTFLTQLSQEQQDFLIILTTNRRDMIDPAILRPGRIDLEIEVGLPDQETRKEIIWEHLTGVPQDVTDSVVEEIAEMTDGWNCAELESIVTKARRAAASQNARVLSDDHLLKAAEQ